MATRPSAGAAPAAALLSVLTLACSGGTKFTAAPPEVLSNVVVESLPPVPMSSLELPVRFDVRPALDWLESEVPMDIGDIEKRIQLSGNKRVHIAYHITREPFQVSYAYRTIIVSSVLHYEGRGWYNPPVLPEISASCGTGDERPRAKLTLTFETGINDNWTLRATSKVKAEPLTDMERDQCEVTAAHIDVTDKVLGAAEGALQGELKKIDAKLKAYPLKKKVLGVWGDMQQPLRLTDSLWLLINPVSLRLKPATVSGDTVIWQAGLAANPRIVGGSKPDSSANPLLPIDRSDPPPPSFLILSEGRLPYDVAEEILSKVLHKKKIKVAGHTMVIQHLKPTPLGDGRVVVALTVTGAAEGTLYAVGRPHIDSAGVLTMPDLTIDANTTDAFTGALAWLAATDRVQDFLRDAIRVNLSKTLESGRELAEKNLNRELASGLFLKSTLTSAVPIGVWAAPDALIARVIVRGTGEMVIDMKPDAPDSASTKVAQQSPKPASAPAKTPANAPAAAPKQP